jgi:dihydrofolate reductase
MKEDPPMTRIVAGITTSIDGYITGPNDGPQAGLGEGGERLHYWVFGGPWRYADQRFGEATGEDKAYLDQAVATIGAVIGGRGTYDAADAWGGSNPWPVPFFILTHRPQEQPATGGFTFVDSFDAAIQQAKAAAGDKDVSIMGGADTIRQALRAGIIDELSISTSPVILGAGKRLFEGFTEDIDLEKVRTFDSPLATHVTYRVKRGA